MRLLRRTSVQERRTRPSEVAHEAMVGQWTLYNRDEWKGEPHSKRRGPQD
jgi:hypothetical protein